MEGGGTRGPVGSPAARGGERELNHNDLAQAPEPRIQVQTLVYSLGTMCDLGNCCSALCFGFSSVNGDDDNTCLVGLLSRLSDI